METIKKALFFYLMLGSVNAVADIGLSWTAPTEREDNTKITLSEIAGYRIYYGLAVTDSRGKVTYDYQYQVDINDNQATSYTFTDLAPNTYHFVMTCIDTDGRESIYTPDQEETENANGILKLLPMFNFRVRSQ